MKERIIRWIREQMVENGGRKVVVGLSGGKDSTVVAALCVEALGKENVMGLIMPEGLEGNEEDISLAKEIADYLGILYEVVDIKSIVEEIINSLIGEKTKQTLLNVPPRVRMTLLYAKAQMGENCRVTCNSNLSEDTMGYATKYGDTAGDLAPIMHLTVREVKTLGYELGVPKEYIEKTPEDGLTGKTDEDVYGFSYEMLDDYILKGTSGCVKVDRKIEKAERYGRHKLEKIPTMK